MASTAEALMIVAVALLVIYVSRKFFKGGDNLNLPPGPTPWPIIGSMHLLGTHPHKSLADLAQKHGPVMSVRLGQRLCVIATSSEAAKEFLKHQDANFSFRPTLRSAEILLQKDLVFGDLTMPVFRYLRKIFVSELTSAKRVEASKYIRAEEVAYMLSSIYKETGPISVSTYVNIMSTNILSRMILSKRFLGGDDHDVLEYIEIVEELRQCNSSFDLQDYFNCIPLWFDPQGLDSRFRKLKARMDLFYRNIINQHKEHRRKNPIPDEKKTLLDVLLEQLHNPEHDVTEEHINGLIWDAFTAGTDTTTVTSEWAMAEVIRNPALQTEARAELDRVVGLNRTVQESDIPELKYIQAIVKETLRLHAPVPLLIPHQSSRATKAFGYDIPATTRLFVNFWGMGRDPRVWEQALEFVPERFLAGARHGGTEFLGQQFEFIPFGAGRRQCPAMALGSLAVHMQVASLLHAFEWSLPGGMAPAQLDMSEGQAITLPMRESLVAVATPRLASHLYPCHTV